MATPVKISQEELWSLNILRGSLANAQAESQRNQAAVLNYISLLELKYGAVFDHATGSLIPLPEPKKEIVKDGKAINNDKPSQSGSTP